MDRKHESLRRELASMGYTEYLSVDSTPLVDRLLSDIKRYSRENRDTKTVLQNAEKERQKQEALALAYQADNGKAMEDINRLHLQLMYIKEEHAKKINDLESKLQQAQDQGAKVEFLKAQYARKISTLEKESQLKSEKILQLQTRSCGQAVIQTTDRRKAPLPALQRMELSYPQQAAGTSATVSQKVPDQRELEVLRMADLRIHQLEEERRQLLCTVNEARLNTELLQKRVEVRDTEIERLTNLLKGGRPADVVLSEKNLRRDVRDEGDFLQEKIAPLGNGTRSKKVVDSRGSSRVRKVNMGHLQKGAVETERKHWQAQKKQMLDKANKELAHMDAVGATSKKLEGQIRALKSEKEELLNRVRQLTNNEKDLLLEIDQLSRHQSSVPDGPAVGMSTATSHLLSMVRELEKERDQYKEEIMVLHDLIKKGGTNGVDHFPPEDGERLSASSWSSASAWDRGKEQPDSLKKLASERDVYREKYYEKCRELEGHTCPKVSQPWNGYNGEAQSLLRQLEQKVLDLNKKLSLATSERDRLARQLSEMAARSQICPSEAGSGSPRRDGDGSQNYGEGLDAGTASRREELNREIGLLEDKLKKSEQQFSAAKVTLASQRMLIETQQSEIQNLQRRLDDATTQYDALLKQTTSGGALSGRRESIQRGFEVRRNGVQQAEVRDNRLRDEVDEVQTEKTALRDKDNQVKEAKAALNAMEFRVSELTSDIQVKDHEIYELKRQVERLQREVASANGTIDEIRRENQKLNSDLSVMAREHQHMAADLENAKQQMEERRRETQEYVTEVARVEELLRYKEKEREELLEQYKNLTLANSELEAQTHDLESLHGSTRVQLQKRDVELDRYCDMVHDLESQLAHHVSRAADYDDQLNALRASMETLKGELEQKDSELRRLREELRKSVEVQQRLNASVQELQERLSSEEVIRQKLASKAQKLEDDLSLARNEAAAARSNVSGLESLVAVARERECFTEANFRRLSSQLQDLQERLNSTSGHREAQMQENAYLRSKLVEFEREVEQLKSQVTNERYEREKTKEELRNLQQHASRGLKGHLTLHGFSGSLRTAVDFSSDTAGAASQNSHSYPYGAAPSDNRPPT